MGIYYDNKPIACTFCGYGPVQGRESTYPDRTRGVVTECRWSCPRCGKLIRCDEQVTEPLKKVEKKEENKNEEKK